MLLLYVVRRPDVPPYVIDDQILKRFDQRRTIFGRMDNDQSAPFFGHGMYEKSREIIAANKNGYSRIEFARMLGAWTVYDYFQGAYAWEKLLEDRSVMAKPELSRYIIDNPYEITELLKDSARFYGAALVGVCRIGGRWIYSHDLEGHRIDIPEGFEYAVVMAMAMDTERIRRSPDFIASAETALGYSRMAFCISCLAEFIRYLGYRTIPIGNDVALSIPLAIDAGLGELGRNGILITPQYGPCVRICKVFTDLPLLPDTPIEFGIRDFCKACRRCVDACEVEAIQDSEKPSYEVACPSNNHGILRWAVNHDKCYQFWVDNGSDCSSCIAACPYTPGAGIR